MSEFEKQQQEPEQLDSFELALQRALRQVEAPESLAASLMDSVRVEAAQAQWTQRRNGKAGGWRARFSPQAWAGSAVAGLVVAGLIFGGVQHHDHVKVQAERAQATKEFDASLQITNEALAQTRLQLQQAGVDLDTH